MAWRRSETKREQRHSGPCVFTSAGAAATYLAAFPIEVEAYVWRAVRAGLDLPFSESEDVETDNDIMQTVVCDSNDDTVFGAIMRDRLVRIANRISRDMHRSEIRLSGDDAPLGWMLPAQLHDTARRRVLRAWERLEQGEDVSEVETSEADMYRLLDHKGKVIRSIIDGAVASVAVGIQGPRFRFRSSLAAAFDAKRQQVVERSLGRRRITNGMRSFSLLQVREWHRQRERAEVCVTLEGLQQIADSRGYVSVHATVTLPAEYHAAGDRSQEAREAINNRVAKIRAIVSDAATPLRPDSFHDDRAAAYARRDEIRANSRWNAKALHVATAAKIDGLENLIEQAVGHRWVVLASEKVGRDALGVIGIEPHQDGTPHLHVAVRCAASVAATMVERLERIGAGDREVVVETRDGTEARKASNYAAKTFLAEGEEADEARAWSRERGIRQVRWIGIRPLKTAWRVIYGASMEEITIDRARLVKMAMVERRWGDALVEIGAIRSAGRQAFRLVYENGVNEFGAPEIGPRRHRVIGIVDPSAPEQGVMPLRPQGMAEWAQTAGEEFSLSKEVSCLSCPRDEFATTEPGGPPDPMDWLEAAD